MDINDVRNGNNGFATPAAISSRATTEDEAPAPPKAGVGYQLLSSTDSIGNLLLIFPDLDRSLQEASASQAFSDGREVPLPRITLTQRKTTTRDLGFGVDGMMVAMTPPRNRHASENHPPTPTAPSKSETKRELLQAINTMIPKSLHFPVLSDVCPNIIDDNTRRITLRKRPRSVRIPSQSSAQNDSY